MDHNHQEHQHDKHAGHSVAMFKDKFWISLILTVPVLIYSEMIQHWLRFTPPSFPGSEYIPFIFSSIIFFYGGLVFIKGSVSEIRNKLPGMMTLISLAIITAYVYSVATQFWISGEGFFWELATLVSIMLLGHWLEMASIMKAENAIDAIAKLLPDTAEIIKDGKSKKVKVSQLKANDIVLVRPGSSVPVDGQVVEGRSLINESAITGESKPITKNIGDAVVAGTINQDGSLMVAVTKVGEETTMAGIMRLVKEAQSSKSNVQVLADKAAFVLTIIAISASIISFIYWLVTKDVSFALERAVTVLIVACPHALGLAIPLVISISTTLSAKNGILVRNRLALEDARKIDWVLFDKTGTLTNGEFNVTDIWSANNYDSDQILKLLASLEQTSEHTIAMGIINEASKKDLDLLKIDHFSAIPGLGVRAEINGSKYAAVSYRYLIENKLDIPANFKKEAKLAAESGKTEVYLIHEKLVIGGVALADTLRGQAISTIRQLESQGVKTAMVTGDSKAVADYIAKELKLSNYFAEVMPKDKAVIVKQLQEQGRKVSFVGDGVNDAPSLAQADVGIAIGNGTDVAIKSADIILARNDPKNVPFLIDISKSTYRKMVQNLIWATGYNIVAIPLAAGVLYNYGVTLSPAVGAVLMSLSTIVVAINAQLLRRTFDKTK